MFERQREMILIHDLFILADTETREEKEKTLRDDEEESKRMKSKMKFSSLLMFKLYLRRILDCFFIEFVGRQHQLSSKSTINTKRIFLQDHLIKLKRD